VKRDAASGRALLEIRPTAAPPVPVGTGGTSTVSVTPWLWVIQTRTDGAWSTEIVPASIHSRPLVARGNAKPSEVRVMTVDRLGVASPAAVLVGSDLTR
jgi:hypothetical protein